MLRRKSSYLLNDLRIFNDIFRKDVAYDNIKSRKKNQSFMSRKQNFGKSTGGQTGSQAFLGLIKDSRSAHIIDGVLSDFWY